MKYIFLFALGITIIAAIITFVLPALLGIDISGTGNTTPPTDLLECETDADCFPSECCHPDSCVNVEPDCERVMCTEECRGGTMDCGCGSCACINGECRVDWTQGSDFCSGGQ